MSATNEIKLVPSKKIRGDGDAVCAADIRIAEVETEGIVEEFENPEYGDHNQHADDAPEHVLLAFLIVSPLIQFPQELDETVDEEEEAKGEDDEYRGVDDVRFETVHYVGY